MGPYSRSIRTLEMDLAASEGMPEDLERLVSTNAEPEHAELRMLSEALGWPFALQGRRNRLLWMLAVTLAALAALRAYRAPRAPTRTSDRPALAMKDLAAEPLPDDGIDHHVLTFWKTGCPNTAPGAGTLSWWRSHHPAEVRTDMYVYCAAVARGTATKSQKDTCCGVGRDCSPTCVKQTAWARLETKGGSSAAQKLQAALAFSTPLSEDSVEACRLASPGGKDDHCYWAVTEAMKKYKDAPAKYPGLDGESSFADFQRTLWRMKLKNCPRPCGSPAAARPPAPAPPPATKPTPAVEDAAEFAAKQHGMAPEPAQANCLCVFDIDRTLTCKQKHAKNCTGVKEMHGIWDGAYGGGTLVLSELAQNIPKTFCGKCYRGIVTAGDASGPYSKERKLLLELLGGTEWTLSDVWSPPAPHVTSSLVVGAADGFKQDSVRGILKWLAEAKGVVLAEDQVHMFDDNEHNPPPFAGTHYNARQVSCTSRSSYPGENLVGFCGGRVSEVVESPGVMSCGGPVARYTSTTPPPPPPPLPSTSKRSKEEVVGA